MKKILATLSALSLLLPAAVLASTVTLTPSTVLSIGGITVNVSSGNAVLSTIVVGDSSFNFTLAPGEYIDISQPSGYKLTNDAQQAYIVSSSCNSSTNEIVFKSTNTTVTITVTPAASACIGGSSSSGGNGAPVGGGGGSSSSYSGTVVPSTPLSTGASTAAALQAQLNVLLAEIAALKGNATPNANAYANANANASFKRDLQAGSSGADVKTLQAYLNTHGYAVVSSGAGSKGNETTKFGALTRAALARFQKAVGISPASGYFGPKTRAYIAAHP